MIKLFHAFILALAVCTVSAGEGWLTDLEAAKKQAAKENKAILVDFTGSDWCGFCIKLDKQVFSKEEFKKYAEKNLVLVEIDFPRSKKQSDELKKANKALQAKYNIEGFPTIVLMNAEGKKLDEFVGYGGEPVDKYIQKIQAVLSKNAKS
jgi:thioredoxin-related protein